MRKEISEIENRTQEILKKIKITEIPVSLEKILCYHKITKLDAPSDKYSGMMLTTDNKTFIGINSTESEERKRFTIAHELGHFFLENAAEKAFVDNSKTIESGIKFEVAFRKKGRSKGEFEEMKANAFAASLLMPANWLINDLKKIKETRTLSDMSINKLADKYQVSEVAMRYRVMNVLNNF